MNQSREWVSSEKHHSDHSDEKRPTSGFDLKLEIVRMRTLNFTNTNQEIARTGDLTHRKLFFLHINDREFNNHQMGNIIIFDTAWFQYVSVICNRKYRYEQQHFGFNQEILVVQPWLNGGHNWDYLCGYHVYNRCDVTSKSWDVTLYTSLVICSSITGIAPQGI